MRKVKKRLSVILILVLILGLMPQMSMTARADEETMYPLWIGGVQVTDVAYSGEGWSYAAGTNTLTLSGVSISTSKDLGSNNYAVVYYNGDTALNINLSGGTTTRITDNTEVSDSHRAYGIFATSDLNISGGGKLVIEAGYVGIYAAGDITIESGELDISGGVNGINGSYNKNLTVNGGKVTATATGTGGTKSGISVGLISVTGGELSGSGQTYGIESFGGGTGVTGISISGGTVTATASGDCGLRASSNISISGGSVTASGRYGIGANNSSKTISIDGSFGDVTFVGTERVISYGTLSTSVTPTVYTDAGGTVSADYDIAQIATYKKMVFAGYKALDTVGNTTPVTIGLPNGHTSPLIGDTLTASCSATNLTYEWFVGGTSTGAASATQKSYTIQEADYGKTIKVKVTQTKNEDGTDKTSNNTLESAATTAVTGAVILNGVGYATIADAFSDASSGDTIKLLANHAESFEYTGKNLILDLAGHTLSTSDEAVSVVSVGGIQLTITDSVGGGKISGATNASGVNLIAGKVILNSGTITGNSIGVNISGGTLQMNGGTVSGNSDRGISTPTTVSGYPSKTKFIIEITGGEVKNNANGLYMYCGTLTATGGKIYNNTGYGIEFNRNTSADYMDITIGGTIEISGNEKGVDGYSFPIKISGAPKIKNNVNTSGTKQNLCMTSFNRITIIEALLEGADIGVTLDNYGKDYGQITSGYATYNSADNPNLFFKSDKPERVVKKTANNEVELTADPSWDGSGTPEDPYLITSAADLRALSRDVALFRTATFQLTQNIDLGGVDASGNGIESNKFTPIPAPGGSGFSGTFDGNHKTIKGLYVNTTSYGGLFASGGGTIKDLTVDGLVKTSGSYAGGIAGYFSGTMENCVNRATVEGGSSTSAVGGLVGNGYNENIRASYNVGTIKGNYSSTCAGGIKGDGSGNITNCYNTGAITGTGQYSGGIAGKSQSGSITNCYNYGTVGGTYTTSGKITGYIRSINISHCYFLGDESSDTNSGIGGFDTSQPSFGNASYENAVPLSDTSFALEEKFEDWNFTSVWGISTTYMRPVLAANEELAYVALTSSTTVSVSGGLGVNPAVGDVLTASCAATDLIYQWYRGNEAISGAIGESYTVTASDIGKTIKVKVTQTKQENGSAYASGSAPTKESSATGAVEKRPPEPLSTDDAKTNAGISYVAETVTPIEGFEVSSSAEAYVAVTSLTAILDAGDTPTIYVRSKETSDMKAGAWVAVTLQGRSAAPQELSSTPAADQETANGTINGTSASQEYKLKGSTNLWTAIGGSSVSVAAGTYLVRERATTERPAGYAAEIVVHSKKLYPTDAQKPTIKSNLTYTGSAQSLLGEPSAELPAGSTMYYALGENAQTAPVFDGTSLEEDKKWSTTIPEGTDAKTYYVWYMAKGDGLAHTDSDPVCIMVTISNSAPSGGGGSASAGTSPTTPTQETYTVSIENESSLSVATEITDGNAKVSEITGEQIQQITANSEETGGSVSASNTITIDVSGATQEVNSVELSKGTVERLADTAMSNNSVDTVTIQMTNAAVEMDAKTLEAVSQQAKDDEIRLVVEDTQHVKLTVEQQSSIRQYTSAATFEAYFISGGTRIGNFKGGVAKVSVKYTLQAGNSKNFLHMIYLPLIGGTEYFPSRYFVDARGYGWVQGDLPHFSDYAIVYDENKLNQDGELAMDPYSGLDQEAFDPDKSDFVEDDAAVLANGKTAYQNGIRLNSGLKLYQKGSTLGVTWGKVAGADGYRIYAAYCGSRMPEKPIKVTKNTKYTIKKLNGKKLNLKKNYKVYVVAYKKVDGVDKVLGRTVTAHVVGRKNVKFSNPKKLTITSKTKVSLKTGKTTKVKAKVTLVSPKRKSLSDGHAPLLRFASSNKKVATVDKTGKVKGIGKGTCVIYVYAKNGYTKKVKITVK